MTTKNNALYNGQNAFVDGRKEVIQNYKDDFWNLLPIERLEVKDEIIYGNKAQNKNFERSEEKSVKSIQRHSMNIDGWERNPKIAKSFLLLGKSRYYDQRFIPSLEAFNYILHKYPTSKVINHAKVWRAKTNIRLDNSELASKNILKLLNEEQEMKDQDRADATAMLSQAYINMGLKDSALIYIKEAGKLTKNNEERGRYHYIKGQLYNELQQKDSAAIAFNEILKLNRRTSRNYWINAHLAKVRNFDYETGDHLAQIELLEKLEKNYENKIYLDKIYYHKALHYTAVDSQVLAKQHYNKSLRTNSADTYLETLNYETLASMSFDASEYASSGAYLDSTLSRLDVNEKRYRRLKKKRDNLDDVILYEGIATVNDSILKVVAMDDSQRLAYYKEFTDVMKEEAIVLQKKAAIEAAKNALPTEQQFSNKVKVAGPNTEKGKFYFYNPTAVAKGKLNFKKNFGTRLLEDNWRISAQNSNGELTVASTEEIAAVEEVYSVETDPTFDPQTYVDRLPTDPKVLDSLATERNFAYYQLGIIYKEKFKEYKRATDKLEGVLVNNPEERLILPSKYNLYKIYQTQENQEKATFYKDDIITNHSDSRYALILKNPDEALEADSDSPEQIYKRSYYDFEQERYQKVLQDCEINISKFTGLDIIPKFELLKARAKGRLNGPAAYKEALNFISLNYPQSIEGKQAQLIYDQIIPKLEQLDFVNAEKEEYLKYKLLYAFSVSDAIGLENTKKQIETVFKELRYGDVKTSVDVYDGKQQFLMVHCRRDKNATLGLAEVLAGGKIEDTRDKIAALALAKKRKRKFKPVYYPGIEKPFVGISSSNYKVVQVQKNFEEYKSYLEKDSIPKKGLIEPIEMEPVAPKAPKVETTTETNITKP